MTQRLSATSLAIVLGLPVATQAADFATMDANGDGYVTMSEFQTALPETPAEAFMSADANADGTITAEELVVAQEKGTLPSDDG